MNPFARFPFMRYVLPLIPGITFEVYFTISAFSCLSFLIFFTVLIFVFSYSKRLRSKYAWRYFFAATLQIFWFTFGMALTSISNETFRPDYFETLRDKKYLVVTLKEPLSHKSKSFKTTGEVTGVYNGRETLHAQGNLLIYFLNDRAVATQLYCGDEIIIVSSEKGFDEPKNPGEFNFKRFLACQNIHRQIFIKPGDWKFLKKGDEFELLRSVYRVRDRLLGILNKYIDDKTERGVAGALLFGYKDELDHDVVDAYARTGTLHVLAVSGMHVAILYFVVSFLFKPFQKKKAGAWLTAVFTILLIWFYSLLSGMAPSIIRASIMFTTIVLGKVLRDDISIYNNLFTSSCVLLCYNPYFLFDAGFQLSYLAVLGIVYFQPKIAQILIFKSWLGKEIWGLITVSVAAQIATAPLSLYYFNQFPNFFILSNLVIIPITTLVMYAGILLIVISNITFLAIGLGYCINKLIAFADYFIFKIQALPLAVTERLYITKMEAVLFYLFIAILSVYFVNANKKYLRIVILLLFTLVTNFSRKNFDRDAQHLLVLNSIGGSFSLNIIEGRSNILFCDSNVSNSAIKLKTHFKGFWNSCGVPGAAIENTKRKYNSSHIIFTNDYLLTAGTSFYFVDENTRFTNETKIKADYLVLCRKCKLTLRELMQHFQFNLLIIDGSMKQWRKTKYISAANQLQIKYYDLLNEGAILIRN